MRFALAAAGAAALTLVLASVASAHAIMSPPVAKSKVAQQFTLSVPTEEAGATTTEIPSSHVAMVSHPAEVADLVEKAAESVGAAVR